jgi:hypothetical protein
MDKYHARAGARNRPLRAELGSNTCTAVDIQVRGTAPVLALCRQLLAAGLDPDQALAVYRSGTLGSLLGAALDLLVEEGRQ